MFNSVQEGFPPKRNPRGFNNKSIKKPFTEALSSADDPILLKDPWKKEKDYADTWLNKEKNNKVWDSLNPKNPWNATLPPKPKQERPIVKKSEKELQEQRKKIAQMFQDKGLAAEHRCDSPACQAKHPDVIDKRRISGNSKRIRKEPANYQKLLW
uniref:Uncharacterized protein n=2 Tax=Moniliophthora roreri TaxID=221103 RepID=A0A0W0GE34_MONRR